MRGGRARAAIGNEIVASMEGIRSLFVATIGLLLAFKQIGWDKDQLGAVLLEFQACSAFLALIVRSHVTPTRQVALTHRDVANLRATPPQPGA